MDWWFSAKEWFFSLGDQYGVNPIIFGAIYVGAIPFFTGSIAWLANNIRKRKSIVLPVLFASFFFVSAYLYLIVVGHDVPVWVYIFIGAMVVFGVYSTFKKVQKKVAEKNR
ncbi:MAG: hypothetical protein ACE5HO_19935 [bacterium]